jgi:hypothetical protein
MSLPPPVKRRTTGSKRKLEKTERGTANTKMERKDKKHRRKRIHS